MTETELALAASARDWADRLHRFLTDHGGARVRSVVMTADDVVEERYDVLLVDDVCSFLTPRVVEQARLAGRLVVGVFDPVDGSDAKRRLVDCGVDDVVESDASPEEFLAVVERVVSLAPAVPTRVASPAVSPAWGRVIAVGGPPGGCGATEVAIALAAAVDSVVVDADDVAPALAQRLAAELHPNLRTAIDMIHHRSSEVTGAIRSISGVRVLAGLASGDDWAQILPGEVDAVIDEMALFHERLVVNVGGGLERAQTGEGRFGLARSIVARADAVVGVGVPTPVGVARLIHWLEEASVLAPDGLMVAVVNRVRRSPYQRGEIEAELRRALPGVPVHFLTEDPRVTEAAWAGTPVGRGPFSKGVGRLAEAVA